MNPSVIQDGEPALHALQVSVYTFLKALFYMHAVG